MVFGAGALLSGFPTLQRVERLLGWHGAGVKQVGDVAKLRHLLQSVGALRGLRLGNLAVIRDAWSEEIEQLLAGKKTAQAALDAAADRGNAMLRQFQRTVK